MKSHLILLAAALVCCACGGGRRTAARAQVEIPAPAAVQRYGYRIRNVWPHSTTSYTQGLQFIDGELWEGTGQNGRSVLQRLDLESGAATVVARLPRDEFGEGITVLDSLIYQLTWLSNTVHIYDRRTGREVRTRRYPGEGWGLTTDGRQLYMSDGSARIHRVDPDGFRRTGSITVTLEGRPVEYLNELEWIEGRIWANVYTSDCIVIIHPETGVVEGVVNLSGLLAPEDVTATTDVLNGIAWDAATGRIFVTGKNWNKLFEIELVEQ